MKNEVKIQLRLPIEVRDWFAKFSANNSRSMNGQMIALMQEKMRQEQGATNVAH